MKFTNFGKKLFAFIAVLTFGLVLVSCGGGNNNKENEQHQANVQAVLDAIFFDETLLSEVKGTMTLVKQNGKYPDVKIEWSSSETDLIDADGKVNRPALDDPRAVDGKVKVTLTVTASQGEAKGSKTFTAYVLGEKKTNVATISNIKTSFYQIIKDADLAFNAKTQDLAVNAEITGEVLFILGTKGFYISDGTGLMYVYKSNPDVKVGDVVTVNAGVYAYYGACQFGSNVTVTPAAAQDFADLTFADSTIDAYTAELNSAIDAQGKIVDLEKMAKYSGEGLNLYAKVGKGNQGTGDPYYLEDPYTGQKVALYYYTTADYESQLDALVGKYVNIKVFTYDRYSTNNMYRVLYSGQAITEAAAPVLSDAQKVVAALGQAELADKLTADLTLPVIEGVAWSLKEAYGNAVIENGVLKVTRPENGEGNVTVVVVATATFGAESDSKEISVEIVEKEDNGIKEVKELDTEKTYKLGLYQGNKAAFLFATGNMSGFYGELVENAATAADVKVIAVEGGYQLLVGSKYLELAQEFNAEQNKTYTNVKFVEEATDFVWVHDTENNTFTHVFEDATYYIGTYGTYNTLSASKLDKIGTSFPAHLYEVKVEQGGETPEQPNPETPVIGDTLLLTANKLFATVDTSKTSYADHNGTHTVDGIAYETVNVLRSNQTAFSGYIQCKAKAGSIKNTTAYSKELKTITFKFYNTYSSPNLPTIKAGATADSLTEVTAVLTGGTGTGVYNTSNGNQYEVLEFTITYTLPAGCYFWEYSDSTSGAKYFSEIVLGF